MKSINELGPVKVAEFRAAIRASKREAKVARRLMLDILAAAYSSEILIHQVYYDRANDVLSYANAKLTADALHAAIMKGL